MNAYFIWRIGRRYCRYAHSVPIDLENFAGIIKSIEEVAPMTRVDPNVLKRLRIAKRWSQEQLAEKTKLGGLPKIDKQTISRLERGVRDKTRNRTIEQLARALSVE